MNASVAESTLEFGGGSGLGSVQTAPFQPSLAIHRPDARPKILYAEDDPSIRRIGHLIMTKGGCSVVAVVDGAEAWSALLQQQYDLLITDDQMPHLTGLELIQKVVMARMEIPIILASGSVSLLTEEELRVGPCRGVVLGKPFSPQHLLSTIDDVLRLPGRSSRPDFGRLDPGSSRSEIHPVPQACRWGINE